MSPSASIRHAHPAMHLSRIRMRASGTISSGRNPRTFSVAIWLSSARIELRKAKERLRHRKHMAQAFSGNLEIVRHLCSGRWVLALLWSITQIPRLIEMT
jgi:hypothetical protein